MMRYSNAEKLEVIRLVERSSISIKQTLDELGVPRSTFYRWYLTYQEEGPDGLVDKKTGPRQFWNKIPKGVKKDVVQLALENPELSPRQLAWRMTDQEEYFISESSVYRILKGYDLIQQPAFEMMTAADEFEHKTKRVNEMWQTDFTQFKVVGWGWYYLCTVLDDYSRYILSWKLFTTMGAADVEETLQTAFDEVNVTNIKVKHRPRLLSDNGPCFVAKALKDYLHTYHVNHIRSAPYHPMTQGKIERYHRSMKNVVKLDTYYFPWELEQSIEEFVQFYNHERYHESLNNMTPANVFFGRVEEVETKRDKIKRETLNQRRLQHQQATETAVLS